MSEFEKRVEEEIKELQNKIDRAVYDLDVNGEIEFYETQAKYVTFQQSLQIYAETDKKKLDKAVEVVRDLLKISEKHRLGFATFDEYILIREEAEQFIKESEGE